MTSPYVWVLPYPAPPKGFAPTLLGPCYPAGKEEPCSGQRGINTNWEQVFLFRETAGTSHCRNSLSARGKDLIPHSGASLVQEHSMPNAQRGPREAPARGSITNAISFPFGEP